MECFDHGKEIVGLCGWCGKQMCPSCIGRQDGRKKYCRDCAAKMGNFTAPDRSAERLQAHLNETAKEVQHDEEPVIEQIPAKMKIQVGHPPEKRIDPKIFELEEDFVPSRKRHEGTEEEKYVPLKHETPKPVHP